MKNRSRLDIVGLILEAALEGATKAKIMDSVNLSILQTKDYLFVLLENGLLCYGKGTGIYKTTEKGLRMLENYNLISKQMCQNTVSTESEIVAIQKNVYEIKISGISDFQAKV